MYNINTNTLLLSSIVHGLSQVSDTKNAMSLRDNVISWDNRFQVSNGGSLDQSQSFSSPQTHSTLNRGVNTSISERWSSGFKCPSSLTRDNNIASLITSYNGSKDDAIGMHRITVEHTNLMYITNTLILFLFLLNICIDIDRVNSASSQLSYGNALDRSISMSSGYRDSSSSNNGSMI